MNLYEKIQFRAEFFFLFCVVPSPWSLVYTVSGLVSASAAAFAARCWGILLWFINDNVSSAENAYTNLFHNEQ